jgi:hypothetical protein
VNQRKWGPFQVNFDKPTYAALKELAELAQVYKPEMVIMAVRMVYALVKNKDLMLTQEGQAKWREIVDSFKKPVGLDT